MVEVKEIEPQQGKLSPDQEVAVAEADLSQLLMLPNPAKRHGHLNVVLTALNSGDFDTLDQYRSPRGDLMDEIHYKIVGSLCAYMKALDRRELLLNQDGISAEKVLQELLDERFSESEFNGHAGTSAKNQGQSRQESEAKGAIVALRTALDPIKSGSNYPVAIIRKVQQDFLARKKELMDPAHYNDLADMVSPKVINQLHAATAANSALEEAINILKGGKVAEVQAHIYRVVTKLIGIMKTGEQQVLLTRESGWESNEDAQAEVGENVNHGPLSRVKVLAHDSMTGTRKQILEWAKDWAAKQAEEADKLRDIDQVIRG